MEKNLEFSRGFSADQLGEFMVLTFQPGSKPVTGAWFLEVGIIALAARA
jgi:hypothetical protein